MRRRMFNTRGKRLSPRKHPPSSPVRPTCTSKPRRRRGKVRPKKIGLYTCPKIANPAEQELCRLPTSIHKNEAVRTKKTEPYPRCCARLRHVLASECWISLYHSTSCPETDSSLSPQGRSLDMFRSLIKFWPSVTQGLVVLHRRKTPWRRNPKTGATRTLSPRHNR